MNRMLLLAIAGFAVIGLLSLEAASQGPEAGQISGFATADGKPVRGATAGLREIESGALTAVSTCDSSGIFAFVNVPPGHYVVELICAGGALIGASAPVRLVPGAMTARGVAIDVNGSAAKAAGAGACLGAGFKVSALADLARRPFRSVLGVAVVTAAGASGVAAVVATKNDASASR